ncbi:purine nucleoside phosphorylase 1 [Andreesenia angusta]|uniref:Purine nucleoside phosphorylase n=1 Tax=Andreesenia angusta TaxID=39480 RepID=A0A1S1V8P1_9FIRM|nr:purine-nucleoside phosphorylase [Andreesenia angusta]OHW62973.1 purine nucleoside phosphorylase 1 [Andreesenia angusta]
MNIIEKIDQTREFLSSKTGVSPEIGLILGSGLGSLADEIEDAVKIEYKDIPHFPVSTVEGHEGALVFGTLKGKAVMAMKGRFHYYEGYDLESVTFPVRVMKSLGVKKIVVTNAAGGSNMDFVPGDLMLIEDHINFSLRNPLIGINYDELGNRFPDMSRAYDRDMMQIAKSVAESQGTDLKSGVYAWVTGPSYETPAEVRMLQTLGVDAVGMSTVPEVIVANHGGIRVLGISCITNMASGILDKPLDHSEVIETSEIAREKFVALVLGILERI